MNLSVNIKKKMGSFLLDIEFETEEGVLGLLGASGCGKSLTLKCIAGIERPDEGHIELNGRVLFDSGEKINLSPQKRKVGYLFQDYALFPNMTVFENIQCAARERGKTQEWIRKFRLEEQEKNYPPQLSGGQKQRVALARMLAAEPDVILLDEPFSALDSFLKSQLERELMNVLAGYGNPVVFVSHDRNEIYRITDTIAVMERGTIVDISEKHELFQAPGTLASTLLTGCKNVTHLERKPDGTYFATDWGIPLSSPAVCNSPVLPKQEEPKQEEKIYRYAAFRAHYLLPFYRKEAHENKFPAEESHREVSVAADTTEETGVPRNLLTCEILREVEDTFSVIVQFRQKGNPSSADYSVMTYETDKDLWKQIKEQSAGEEVRLRIPEEALIWLEK